MSSELRITLDARRWGVTGIGRYVQELCTHLTGLSAAVKLQLLGPPSLADKIIGARIIPYQTEMYSLREQLLGGLKLRGGEKADLYHIPHYNTPVAPPTPLVVTVHDLTHFRFADELPRWKVVLAKSMLRRSVNAAARVICVSESTRTDLAEMFPDVADKVVVIPQGVSSFFSPCEPEEIARFKRDSGLKRYLLYVGSGRVHKGYEEALSAFSILKSTIPDVELVCAGQFAVSAAADGVRHLGYVSDEELRRLYSGAECLLFTSLYEGFGLPPLEAMACGCPVVCGGGSSLDEVCGDAAVRADVRDPKSLAESVNAIICDQDRREEYIRRGLERAGKYSWREVAAATLAVYREVAGRRADESK
ncbi:MAG: glycosyltransferase family 4 protein [Planctomycetota bacterium]|jgi:alpha-1,3-rhamnosyl/mannosyltransferase